MTAAAGPFDAIQESKDVVEKAPPIMAQLAIEGQKGLAGVIGGQVKDLPPTLDFKQADAANPKLWGSFGQQPDTQSEAKSAAFDHLVKNVNDSPAQHLASDASAEHHNNVAQLNFDAGSKLNMDTPAKHLDFHSAPPLQHAGHSNLRQTA